MKLAYKLRMKTSVVVALLLSILSLIFSCKQQGENEISVRTVDAESADAINPYFTTDHLGNTVLCWTAIEQGDSVYRLKYAVYDVKADNFGDPITVSTSSNLSTSAESMGKVAFKSDGTVIAIFGKKTESDLNRFAGAVYYSASKDDGKTWSPATIIHSDTSRHAGHSFFDITRLKSGELAAIWLDGRFGKSEDGSALFFAKTENGNEFGTDMLLDKNTCECCRTKILSDDDGNIHIAYRGLDYSKGNFGKQVRDMVYLSSKDEGRSFSEKKPISNDNWEVEGCPHTGPSIAVNNQQVHAVWFTAANATTGLYIASAPDLNHNFNKRTRISSSGRHPQMAAFNDNKFAVVFEDRPEIHQNHSESDHHSHDSTDSNSTKKDHSKTAMNHSKANMDHSKMDMNHSTSGATGIVLQVYEDGTLVESKQLSDGKLPDHHAVISSGEGGFFVAWVRESGDRASIQYTRITHP